MSIDARMLFSRLMLELTEPPRWSKCTAGAPRVYYGSNEVAARNAVLSGGAVKLQDLSRAYPNCAADPNILYLVSSGLPPHATRIAEMAKNRGAKVVLNQNGVAYPACYPDNWSSLNATMVRLMKQADHVFYQSKFCKMAADKFLGECAGSSEILYNPVDTKVFVPCTDRKPTGPLRLLLAGTHCDLYRVRVAIETVAELSRRGGAFVLNIAGRYNWRSDAAVALKEAEEMVRSEGVIDRVNLTGAYTQEQAVSMFQNSDILLHTQYNDSCPRLVVEAMACGLPVVYSASGGVPELAGDEAGVGVSCQLNWDKVQPPAPAALADAVEKVAVRINEFQRGGRERACRLFDVEPWLKKHSEVFERLLTCQK